MSRRKGVVAEFLSDPSWKLLEGRSEGDLWTDDYSNILELFTGSHKQPTTSKNALLISLVYFF